MSSADFRYPLRVYWEDTDAGGVVYYANYLKYFERARTEWLRALGHSQQRLQHDEGLVFVVGEARVRYLRPARLDDAIEVSVRPAAVGRAGLAIAQRAFRAPGGELLAEGDIRIACVDAGTFKPRRIPTRLLASLA